MRKTILLQEEIPAGSEKTVVSKRIPWKFTLKELAAKFELNDAGKSHVKFFIAFDDSIPAVGEPAGINPLTELGEHDYLSGDDEEVKIETELDVMEESAYIKMYVNNTDTYDHTIRGRCMIEIIEEGGK